jgi:hypothetical protein
MQASGGGLASIADDWGQSVPTPGNRFSSYKHGRDACPQASGGSRRYRGRLGAVRPYLWKLILFYPAHLEGFSKVIASIEVANR